MLVGLLRVAGLFSWAMLALPCSTSNSYCGVAAEESFWTAAGGFMTGYVCGKLRSTNEPQAGTGAHMVGFAYCFTKEGYKGSITVFGDPQKLFKFFTVGVEKGVLKAL